MKSLFEVASGRDESVMKGVGTVVGEEYGKRKKWQALNNLRPDGQSSVAAARVFSRGGERLRKRLKTECGGDYIDAR